MSFSSATPALSKVIPAMDAIDEEFSTRIAAAGTPAPIRATLSLGKWTLNQYYAKTDYSDLYRCTMGESSYQSRC